jgi:GxxExxY protein
MAIELEERGLKFLQQTRVSALYKGRRLGEYRIDLVVEDLVVVEVKSVAMLLPVFDAQVLTYLRLSGKRIGLLINFHSRVVKDGIRRFVL